jgi:hypothetical protein
MNILDNPFRTETSPIVQPVVEEEVIVQRHPVCYF